MKKYHVYHWGVYIDFAKRYSQSYKIAATYPPAGTFEALAPRTEFGGRGTKSVVRRTLPGCVEIERALWG